MATFLGPMIGLFIGAIVLLLLDNLNNLLALKAFSRATLGVIAFGSIIAYPTMIIVGLPLMIWFEYSNWHNIWITLLLGLLAGGLIAGLVIQSFIWFIFFGGFGMACAASCFFILHYKRDYLPVDGNES